jgi:hypothetical protein
MMQSVIKMNVVIIVLRSVIKLSVVMSNVEALPLLKNEYKFF